MVRLRDSAALFEANRDASEPTADPRLAGMDSASLVTEEEAAASLKECLETVPSIYFEKDYRLEDQPFMHDESQGNESEDEAKLQAKKHLQEKLTRHLDMVETNLLNQVSIKSKSFFEALFSVQVSSFSCLSCSYPICTFLLSH